ncbi:hypothetical protein [Bacillus sp. 2205SS5-2]
MPESLATAAGSRKAEVPAQGRQASDSTPSEIGDVIKNQMIEP